MRGTAAIAVVLLGACGGKVEAIAGSGDSAANEDAPGGSGTVDDACYAACRAKGVPAADCTSYCSGKKSSGGKGGGSPGKGGSSGSSGSSGDPGGDDAGSGGDAGGKPDPAVEKPCLTCLNDTSSGSACVAQATACRASLACRQLSWCPLSCSGADCFDECNQIIPTGVAPLRALVQCGACGAGPCAAVCQGSVMRLYCN